MNLDTMVSVSNPRDCLNLLKTLFQTKRFLSALDNAYAVVMGVEGAKTENLVEEVFVRALKRPLIVFDYTNYELENGHFTTLLGMVGRRNHYTNRNVNDLYYLHEIAHAATMEYGGMKSIQDFHRRTGLNELFAATLTEVYVYDIYPSLRKQTFEFPIWRDDVRPGASEKGNHNFKMSDFMANAEDRDWDSEFLAWIDKRHASIRNPDYLNLIEMQISAYAAQNAAWTQVWAKSWQEVVVEMESYLASYREADTESKRMRVLTTHLTWVLKEQMRVHDITPFQREAEAFAEVVKDTKRRMGNIALFNKSC